MCCSNERPGCVHHHLVWHMGFSLPVIVSAALVVDIQMAHCSILLLIESEHYGSDQGCPSLYPEYKSDSNPQRDCVTAYPPVSVSSAFHHAWVASGLSEHGCAATFNCNDLPN